MWTEFVKNMNGDIDIDYVNSFYCGDAAGRPKTATRPKDFSDGDRKFALNINLPFKTPEMLFLSRNEKLPEIGFNAKDLEKNSVLVKGANKGDKVELKKKG